MAAKQKTLPRGRKATVQRVLERTKDAADRILLHRRVRIIDYENILRIGSDYGGWAIPADRLEPHSICYCVGIGEDTTFEHGLIERYGCSVHSFDPTPVAVEYVGKSANPPEFHFHPVGLWSQNGEILFHAPQNPSHASYSAVNLQATKRAVRCPVKTLSTLMSELGHQRIDLLKMDIEGAEFDVIDSLLDEGLDVDTICVEFHRGVGGVQRIIEAITLLEAHGWMPIFAERWNITLSRLGRDESGSIDVRESPQQRLAADARLGASRSSAHYEGQRGAEYFGWQNEVGEIGADLNLWKFVDHVRPDHSVVDFGCGNGALLARLAAHRKIGVEVNPVAREAASFRGIEVVRTADEIPAMTADVVISNHTLEHTLNPLAELRSLYNTLKPGGVIVVWLPLDDWRSQRRYQKERNHHLFAWTPLSLGHLFDEAGFEEIQTRAVTRAWLMSFRSFSRVLPYRLYSLITVVTAAATRRRQLFAHARRPLDESSGSDLEEPKA
jgi:FkbM family methyltransferase